MTRLREHAGEVLALRGGAAHVGDRLGCGRPPRRRPSSIVASVTGSSGERVAGFRHEAAASARRRRARSRADSNVRAVGRERDAGGGVDDGDVHLVARDEALEGGAAVRRRRREASARRAARLGRGRSARARCRTPRPGRVRVPFGPAISQARRARSASGWSRRRARRCRGCRRGWPATGSGCRR